jgi:HK97 family phage prohead protease
MLSTLEASDVIDGGVKPTDNLIRSRFGGDSIELRDDGGDGGRTLHGHFSVFNTWTEISSRYEGRFLERVAPGAFSAAFADPKNLRVLYEHGADPSIGNKPIAAPTVLRQDDTGAYYEAEMFDASYSNDLLPALRAGQLGASFRFRVIDEEYDDSPKRSDHNPEQLPERTIRSVALYEFGPCTWGAYPDATAGVRSGTDSFIDRLLTDPTFVARLTERAGLTVVERMLADVPGAARTDDETPKVTNDVLRMGFRKSLRDAQVAIALSVLENPS